MFRYHCKRPAIVRPVKGKQSPDIGPVSVLAATRPDLNALRKLASLTDDESRNLFTGKLFIGDEKANRFSLAGPFVGAPYGVMLLETLIAWGALRFIFWGWCGAISKSVQVGDIIIPTGAMIDEGTSRHYQDNPERISRPSPVLVHAIQAALRRAEPDVHEGLIWTTDAVFRETREKVLFYQSRDVLAVEMELSALFTVAAFHHVDIGGVLVVSDELSDLTWKPGFKNEQFKMGRMAAADAVYSLCKELS
jgi:purine-nucleoside phosphorylase